MTIIAMITMITMNTISMIIMIIMIHDHHHQVWQLPHVELVAERVSMRLCGWSSRQCDSPSQRWQVLLLYCYYYCYFIVIIIIVIVIIIRQRNSPSQRWQVNSLIIFTLWSSPKPLGQIIKPDTQSLSPRNSPLEIFIALMCRKIKLHYEGDQEYKGLVAQRFIPAMWVNMNMKWQCWQCWQWWKRGQRRQRGEGRQRRQWRQRWQLEW